MEFIANCLKSLFVTLAILLVLDNYERNLVLLLLKFLVEDLSHSSIVVNQFLGLLSLLFVTGYLALFLNLDIAVFKSFVKPFNLIN